MCETFYDENGKKYKVSCGNTHETFQTPSPLESKVSYSPKSEGEYRLAP